MATAAVVYLGSPILWCTSKRVLCSHYLPVSSVACRCNEIVLNLGLQMNPDASYIKGFLSAHDEIGYKAAFNICVI